MYITLEADYAVRIVDCLAQHQMRMDAKSLSAATGVTLRFALKILRKLVAEGIVRSYKGTQGGYELARPAGEIALGEVIEIVEGPIVISRCVGDDTFPVSYTHLHRRPQRHRCGAVGYFRQKSRPAGLQAVGRVQRPAAAVRQFGLLQRGQGCAEAGGGG